METKMYLNNKKSAIFLFIICFLLKINAHDRVPFSLKLETTDEYDLIEKELNLSYELKLKVQNFSIFALYKESSLQIYNDKPNLLPSNYGGQFKFFFNKSSNITIIVGSLSTSGIMSLAKNPVPSCYTTFSRQVSSINISLFSLNTTSVNPDDKNIAILWENTANPINFGIGTAFDFKQNTLSFSGTMRTTPSKLNPLPQKKMESLEKSTSRRLFFKEISFSLFGGIHLNQTELSEKDKILYPQFPKGKQAFFTGNLFSETNNLKLKTTIFFEPHYKYENCYSTRLEAEFKPFTKLKLLQTLFYSSFSSQNWNEEFISTRFLSNTGIIYSPNFCNLGVFLVLKKPSQSTRWCNEPFNLKISPAWQRCARW